jgi:hypothetical protein
METGLAEGNREREMQYDVATFARYRADWQGAM